MRTHFTKTAFTSVVLLTATGCTGQLASAFHLIQQQQDFNAQIDVNTKIDLLWVVDNSSSMDVSQEKLRNGFSAFAQKYMQPTWDIRSAVITTDTYLANSAFQPYLSEEIAGTTGWTSPYVKSRLSTFQNPSWDTKLVNLSTGAFDFGLTINDLIPAWGSNYGRLLPGLHDGPIAGFCFEGLPYFFSGVTQCAIRDNQDAYNGPSHCLNPASGENSLSQCVNTIENDSIHSGEAIISTLPPVGTPADSAWTQGLINNFIINVTTGSAGHGSERGLGSVLELLNDNEPTPTAFFRPNSTRVIIFVSDEDDQTFEIEQNPPTGFNPWTHYACDQASLLAQNSSNTVEITGTNGFCCATAGNNCRFGSEGTSCPAKTVDDYTYTISVCPVQKLLMPVADVKSKLDSFFLNLDGSSATTPNYLIVSIVALTSDAIQSLQASRQGDDVMAGSLKTIAVDRADRYVDLGNSVGNGSIVLNIADTDYTAILDSIGQAIIQQKSTFTLTRAPTSQEDMIVTVLHADGTTTTISPSQYVINGKSVTITDLSLVLSFSSTDKITINYQPKTVY